MKLVQRKEKEEALDEPLETQRGSVEGLQAQWRDSIKSVKLLLALKVLRVCRLY